MMGCGKALAVVFGCAKCRTVVVGLILVASAHQAIASPIQLYGGTLDGTLRFFDFQHTDDYSVNFRILRKEYVLGVDFMPAVPLSNQLGGVPYTGCAQPMFPSQATFYGPCGATATALTSSPSIFDYSDIPAQLTPLSDGCSPPYFNPGHVAIVVRGNCSFSERWQELEGARYNGVLLQNNVPGLLTGGLGLLPHPPGTTEPTIPFMLITQEVANELRSGSRGYDLSFNRDPHRYYPMIQMRVTWTPLTNPDTENPPLDPGIGDSNEPPPRAVPEPGSLTFILFGVALCSVLRANLRAA